MGQLFFAAGALLFLGSAVLMMASFAARGALGADWQARMATLLLLAEGQLESPRDALHLAVWVAGMIGAAIALMAGWHFAEARLPTRLDDLMRSMLEDAAAAQPQLLALARAGVGAPLPDIERSWGTRLRSWTSLTLRQEARVLAASARRIGNEARALASALRHAEHRQITAHLIRGYQLAGLGDDRAAFAELESAMGVSADDILSRDIAAGFARRMGLAARELGILAELKEISSRVGNQVAHARALRRHAELLWKRKGEDNLLAARDLLNEARDLLHPLTIGAEAKLELGRILTLLCEVQCERTVVRQLAEHRGPLRKARELMGQVAMHRRDEEPAPGEAYGKERLAYVEERIAELLDDRAKPAVEGD